MFSHPHNARCWLRLSKMWKMLGRLAMKCDEIKKKNQMNWSLFISAKSMEFRVTNWGTTKNFYYDYIFFDWQTGWLDLIWFDSICFVFDPNPNSDMSRLDGWLTKKMDFFLFNFIKINWIFHALFFFSLTLSHMALSILN